MDLSVITTYVSPIIVIACLVIGFLIKSITSNEKITRFIPIIVAVIGMVANIWATGVFDIYTIVTGAISGLASTGLYEAFANFLKKWGIETPTSKED